MDEKKQKYFRGTSFQTMDPKGRIIIPTRFRNVLKAGGGDGIMVTTLDNALFSYTYTEWQKVEEKVLKLHETTRYMRRFRRIFIGGASDCTCDKQGRILLPPMLRENAGLTKEIALVGQIKHFEIWSKHNYELELKKLEEDLNIEEVSNEIAKLGL